MSFRTIGIVGLVTLISASLFVPAAKSQVRFRSPQPGEVYKEFTAVTSPNVGEQWRVTDPNINLSIYPQAAPYLPNPQVPIGIDDLSGATRAEVVITMWGGHIGTTAKKINFNGNSWITIPEANVENGIPVGNSGECYLTQYNVTLDVPLAHLHTGTNYYEGTNGGQTCYGFQWGQFGWYGVIVRVYYNPATKPHAEGVVSSVANAGALNENPTVGATITSGTADRVDFLAWYDGYDTDGDGIYQEYHHDYHIADTETDMNIKNHVGTAYGAPFQVTWNTTWVPDQPAGGVKLLARIRSTSGIWYVTPEVVDLSLVRSGRSVKLYKPTFIPERAWARGDLAVVDVPVTIPSSDQLGDATGAVYYNRTWNGLDIVREPGETHYRRLNGWDDPGDYGGNHRYGFDVRSVPTNVLQSGQNLFSFYSQTVLHHGMEILFPGPGLSVEYTGAYASPAPVTPALASPTNDATHQSVSLALKWRRTVAASSFRLQVAKDAGFSTLVVNDSTLTDTLKQIGPLESNVKYYWRVRAKNAAGYSSYSTVWNFSTNVSATALVSPANNSTALPTTVQLVWRATPGAGSYQVQVATDSAYGAGALVKDTTLADTTKSLGGLVNATRYFWHARAIVTGVPASYSPSWAFETIVAAPQAPVLLSPADGAVGQPASLQLRWQSSANASLYHVQLSADAGFLGELLVNDSLMVDTSRAVAGLSFDTPYYWRVRATGPGGTGSFGAARSFRTLVATPNSPVLVSPPNGATGQPTSGLTFTWRSVAAVLAYRFQLTTDSTFTGGFVKNDTSLVDTFRVINGLQTSTRYFWRVSAKNASGWSTPSASRNFTTLVPVPGAPALVAPAHQSLVSKDSARFSWNRPTPGATRYWFEIAVDSLFGSFKSVDSTVTDTTKLFKPLLANTRYFWRVRGGNAGGWGAFSEVRAFNVLVTGVADRAGMVPREFTLEQNYPNPFNPSTTISFGIPEAGPVQIGVYTLLGEKVADLFDGPMAAGYHEVVFDASRLSSGVYLYRMTSSGVTMTKRMALVK
jgi:hypothetical protein